MTEESRSRLDHLPCYCGLLSDMMPGEVRRVEDIIHRRVAPCYVAEQLFEPEEVKGTPPVPDLHPDEICGCFGPPKPMKEKQ